MTSPPAGQLPPVMERIPEEAADPIQELLLVPPPVPLKRILDPESLGPASEPSRSHPLKLSPLTPLPPFPLGDNSETPPSSCLESLSPITWRPANADFPPQGSRLLNTQRRTTWLQTLALIQRGGGNTRVYKSPTDRTCRSFAIMGRGQGPSQIQRIQIQNPPHQRQGETHNPHRLVPDPV